MPNTNRPEFEAEYHFTHKGTTYQVYFNPTEGEIAYQQEIDQWLPGIKGAELETIKKEFVNSLHFYPKKDQDKFPQPQYKYTPRNSTTLAYKTLTMKVMGFPTASASAAPISPEPCPPPWNEHNKPGGGDRGKDPNNENPSSPHGDRDGNPPDRGDGGPLGGRGSRGGGPGGPPPRLQQPAVPIQGPPRGRVKIKAPNVFNRDWEQTQIFLDQLYLLFKRDLDKYQTDDAKVATAISYIKGPNATWWWQNKIDQLQYEDQS